MNDDFLAFDGLEADITALIKTLDETDKAVQQGVEIAAEKAAEVIQKEQQRLLSKEFPQHTDKIKIHQTKKKNKDYKLKIGYDTATIKDNFELLLIEFGRPGKSVRRRKATDKLGRKKGDFPRQVSHIRAGAFLAKDECEKTFQNTLYDIAKDKFNE